MPSFGEEPPEPDRMSEAATQECGNEAAPPDPLSAESLDIPDRHSREMSASDELSLETSALNQPEPADGQGNGDTGAKVDSSTSGCQKHLKKEFWLKPPDPEIDCLFWLFYGGSIVLLVLGAVFNIFQLVKYARGSHWYYFVILLSSMLVPQILINPLSYWWSENDYADRDQLMPCQEKVLHWVAGFVFLTWDTGNYAWKISRHKKTEHYHAAFLRQADMAHIRLINTFISSGPQLVLKVYRLMNEEWGGSVDGWDVFFSIVTAGSLAISIRTVSVNSRLIRYDKKDVCHAGEVSEVISQLCLLSSKVMALACLFSLNRIAGLVVCILVSLLFFLLMTFWKSAQTNIMKTKARTHLYHIIMALVSTFCYINMSDNPALKRYVAYYCFDSVFTVICFVCFSVSADNKWWVNFFLIPFCIGIFFRLLNYRLFHPVSGSLYQRREQLDWERECPHCKIEKEEEELQERENKLLERNKEADKV